MIQSYSLFKEESEVNLASIESNHNVVIEDTLWDDDKGSDEKLYQQIVYAIIRTPKRLITHLQRIHFTYTRRQGDCLYAALVDLLLVLDGKGHALGLRMVSSTRDQLTTHQCDLLDNYFECSDKSLLIGNRFSVLTDGVLGTLNIITEKKSDKIEHDPLIIARDYVQYSQLDAAINTLEVEIQETPERLELQDDLLELYRVTENTESFSKMYKLLIEKTSNLSHGWLELNDSFAGLRDEQ